MSGLVVALDVPDPSEAEAIVDELYDLDLVFKIGLEPLFGYGDRIRSYCDRRDVRCCLDAKLHDIPRTVAAAARALLTFSARMLTVHAVGGLAMMRAAVDSVRERASELDMRAPDVFAVTLLTSMDEKSAEEVGLGGEATQIVMRLASLARDAGCSGIVCSPREVREVKAVFGDDLLTLVPGVRPAGADAGDQRRAATPSEAIAAGADYLVVGRPILAAADRRAAALAILEEMVAQR